jgi:hypothetical protein
MTSSGLTPEDRAALSESVNNLSDINARTRARLDAGVERAYATARGIGSGILNPLTH